MKGYVKLFDVCICEMN